MLSVLFWFWFGWLVVFEFVPIASISRTVGAMRSCWSGCSGDSGLSDFWQVLLNLCRRGSGTTFVSRVSKEIGKPNERNPKTYSLVDIESHAIIDYESKECASA
jgi:hypothetical protein